MRQRKYACRKKTLVELDMVINPFPTLILIYEAKRPVLDDDFSLM
ncbi:MAG: hypothetical protein ABSD71_10630 [Bacteroidales bacterium]